MTVVGRLLIVFVLVLSHSNAFAQTQEAIAQAGNEVKEAGIPEAPSAVTGTALPDSPSALAMQDPATRQKYLESVGRYYEYRRNGFEFRSRVFEWQLASSRVIFVIVVLLVVAGIYFSAVQFHVAVITARRAAERAADSSHPSPSAAKAVVPPALPEVKPPPLTTQLEISAKGIIVNSSVLGVIVLALSLGFFYLYLVYVYPIHDTL